MTICECKDDFLVRYSGSCVASLSKGNYLDTKPTSYDEKYSSVECITCGQKFNLAEFKGIS